MPALPAPLRLLILGGTTEGSRLATALVGSAEVAATVSLAGRTQAPLAPPLPLRIGGFGGVGGLVAYLDAQRIAAVIDATHPFAARISAHAATACAALDVPLAVFTRPPWCPQPGDRWQAVASLEGAAAALGPVPRRVFLTTGRLGLAAFRPAAQHDYLIRTIDPPEPADLPPRARLLLSRGPFTVEDETALMRRDGTEVLVTKNSGGAASAPKLAAARMLGLDVIVVEPPPRPAAAAFFALAEVLAWIAARQRASP